MIMKRSYIVTLLIFAVLLADQALKIYIKTHFEYNEDVAMYGQNWARLHFVENEGMAFGITFDWEYGKLLLSLFRILMVAGLIWYIGVLIKANAPSGFVYSIGLITAGAVGNIIDSAFYGMIFTESERDVVAQWAPFGQGYGTFLHGKVVDMFYFPIKWITLPDWVPAWGGESFLFFSPIFNIADAAITCGVLSILIFQRRFFKENPEPAAPLAAADDATEAVVLEQDMPDETAGEAEHSDEAYASDENTAPQDENKDADNTVSVKS